jgi:hypothetical protein
MRDKYYGMSDGYHRRCDKYYEICALNHSICDGYDEMSSLYYGRGDRGYGISG